MGGKTRKRGKAMYARVRVKDGKTDMSHTMAYTLRVPGEMDVIHERVGMREKRGKVSGKKGGRAVGQVEVELSFVG
jgi:predicted site-specific integrase-resolvase